jgi:CRP/FNR family cyclic AMP-dependent transcriptional regulator
MQAYNKTYKNGAHLFHENDHSRELYILQSGRVRVYRKIGGRDIELAILTKGAVLGEMALIDGKPRSASAAACEETSVIMIDAETFAKRISGVPSWFLSMVRTTSEKIRKANARLDAIQTGSHCLHVVLALQYFLLRYGKEENGLAGRSLDANQTVLQFIQLLTVGHQCVMKILDLLQRNGMIEVKDKWIVCSNQAKLDSYCDYLRHMFRKSFDKIGVISPRFQKMILALHDTVQSLPIIVGKGREVSAADMLAVCERCDTQNMALDAVNELKDAGALTVIKGAIQQPANKDNPLSGLQLFVDPTAFEKFFLYCSFKEMMTAL